MSSMLSSATPVCPSARRAGSSGTSTAAPSAQPHGQPRRSQRLQAYARQTMMAEDLYKPVQDFPEENITMGKRIGAGAYGFVFEGYLELPGGKEEKVILKRGKQTLNGARFMRSEVAVARRLKGVRGVAPFLGVAGPDSYLVWKHLGLDTLDGFLAPRGDALANLYDYWYEPGEDEPEWDERAELTFFKEFARKLLSSASAVHGKGIVHRDLKPSNLLVTGDGEILVLDLGAAADLKTGTNYDEDESVLDQLYGPPEQYVEFQRGNNLFFNLTWNKFQPDLFDSYSIGLILMQAAVKYVRSRDALRRMRVFVDQNDSDLDLWRERQSSVAQKDFYLLDMDNGAGWKFIKGLMAPRNKRTSVGAALKDSFLKAPMTWRMSARNQRN